MFRQQFMMDQATKDSCMFLGKWYIIYKGESLMSKKDKLIDRLLKKPRDFTFDEMESLLSCFGYKLKQGGTGSGVKFIKDGNNEVINFHKPHPSGILKRYVLEQVIEKLRKDGLI